MHLCIPQSGRIRAASACVCPTCDTNDGPLCGIQDLPRGCHRAFAPLVLGQVPGQGVSRTGDAAPLTAAFLRWGSVPASVSTGRHRLPSLPRSKKRRKKFKKWHACCCVYFTAPSARLTRPSASRTLNNLK